MIFRWCLCLTWYTKPLRWVFICQLHWKATVTTTKLLAEKVQHTTIWVLFLVVFVANWAVGEMSGMAEATGHSTVARYISITDSREASTLDRPKKLHLLYPKLTSAEIERLFSHLKLTKSDWRASLGNKRLNQLLNMKLNMEEEMWESIKYEAEVKCSKLIQMIKHLLNE